MEILLISFELKRRNNVFIGVNFESSLNQMNLGQFVKIPLPMRCRKLVVSSGAAMLVNLAAAELTYLDAQAGPGGNTFATGGSLADTSWINPDSDTGSDDDQWKIRTFGNNADVFQALHAGTSIPELTDCQSMDDFSRPRFRCPNDLQLRRTRRYRRARRGEYAELCE